MTEDQEKDQMYRDTLMCATVQHQAMMMSTLSEFAENIGKYEMAANLEMLAQNADRLWRGFAERFELNTHYAPTPDEVIDDFFNAIFGEETDVEVEVLSEGDAMHSPFGDVMGAVAEPDPGAVHAPAGGLMDLETHRALHQSMKEGNTHRW